MSLSPLNHPRSIKIEDFGGFMEEHQTAPGAGEAMGLWSKRTNEKLRIHGSQEKGR